MSRISLGYSPCPNDTYIFYGLVHEKIDGAPRCREILEDIETLNRMAMAGKLDMTKNASTACIFAARYCLLHSAGALGRGCGPAVIASRSFDPRESVGNALPFPANLHHRAAPCCAF